MDVHRHHKSLALLIFILATYFGASSTKHQRRHHHGEENLIIPRFPRQNNEAPYYHVENGNLPESGNWSPWTTTGECTRSCGGGIAYQTRQCNSYRSDGSESCTGPSKRYFSCNLEECPDTDADFRSQQCSLFNNIPFDETYYNWVPYTKAPNKCELNCMPQGERFYYRHKKQVIDGTPCDDEKLDVCVNGKCLPVGCDHYVGSPTKEDKCRVCGGTGDNCNTERGILDRNDLQVGYNDLLLIPVGAMNIRFRELRPSNNYLAIRNVSGHYYLNGNWRIDFPRSFKFCGSTFHYERRPPGFFAPEIITALGPITEAIYLVILYQERNTGIEYEYSIRKGSVIATDPDGYSWKYDDFSNCSTTCGGGFRLRNVWCAKRKDSTPVSTDLCDPALEPISNQSCAQQACPPKWAVSEWSECTKSCGSDGIQNRTVSCEQISASGQSVKVDNYLCEQTDGSAPNSTQSCNVGLACPKWYIGPWKGCDKLCGDGVQRRDVRCYRKTDGQISVLADSACPEQKPPSEKPCFIRPCEGVDWILSDWTGCENKCGLSTETRSAICATLKGNIYPEKFCKKSKLPSLSRDCQGPLCEHQWYASQWSECSSKCSNGVQTRKVFCGTEKNDSIVKVDNSKCDPSKKYNDTQPCAGTEQCKGDWFAGPWSSCSKPCGGGQMTRKVLCMLENKTVDAKLCDVEKIVFASESCNDKPCGHDEIMPVEPTSTVSEEETEECEEYEDVTKPTVKKKNKARRKRSVEFIDADDTFADEEDAPSNYDFDSFGMLPLNSDQLMHRVRRQVIITTGGDDSSSTSDSTSVSTDSSSISSTSEENSSTLSSSESTDSTVSNDTSSTSEITTLSSGTSLDSRSSEFTTKKGISTEAFNSTTNGAAGATNRSDVTTDTPVNGTKFSVTSTEPGITKKLYDILNSTVSAFLNRTDSITESTLSLLRSTLSFSVSTPSPSSDLSSATEASTVESNSSSTTSSSSESSSTEPTSSSELSSTPTSSSSESSSTEPTSSSELSSTPTSSSSESSSTEPTLSSSESSSTELTSSSESSSTEPTSSSESSSTELTSSSESSSTEPTSSSESSSTEPTSSSESSSTEPTSSSESSSTEPTSSSESSSTEPTSSSESSSTEPTLSSSESSSTELTSSSESSSTELTSSSESSSTEPTSSSSGPLSSTEPSTELSSSESSSTSSSETTDDITSTTEFSSSISTYFESSSGTSEITSEKVSTSPEYSSESSLSTNDSSTSEMTSIESSSSEGTLSTASLASVTSSLISTTTESSTLESSESTASERSSNTFSVTTELYSTTMNPLLTAVIKEMTTRRCKKKKRKPKCESSEFGCCFDGITSASGPFSAGCESVSTCRDTKYGCCPDEVTPADGPDNSGCPVVPCSETLYGCCPDGVSTAEGNDNEGCPEPTTTISTIITTYSCKTSEFGCCPDGISPAGGPDYSGCFECIEGSGDCDHCNQTKYGCCPDGLSAASGPGYTGCEETSSISSSTEYEYSSTISSSSTEYEYSSTISSSSTEYDYSSTVSSSSTEYDYSSTISTSSTDYLENCTLSKFGCCPDDNTTAALGPNKEGCKAACASSYYGCCDDNVTDAHGPYKEGCCLNTQYGCCPDNRLAASGPNLEGCSCLYTIYGCCPDNVTAAKGPGNEGCGCQYTEFGCCPNKYTAASGPNYEGCDCHTFQFGCCPDGVTTAKGSYNQGCGCENTKYGCCADGKTPATNENRTCTCEASKYGCCPDGINEAQGEHFEGCSNIPLRPSEICILPKDKGPCHDYTVKWFFDPEYSGCNRFWYGGCEGNANRFRSQEECQSTCVQPSGREACFLPKLKGSCDGYFPTWYYDSTAKQCGQFIYSGCLGNNNKFQSREECESLCVEPDKLEACEQEVAPGPCNGTFPRWYYDKASSQCRQFAYGGCKSNANNFLTEAECQQRCSQPGKPRVFDCSLPKDTGSCHGHFARWYYDSTSKMCKQFVYGGCLGNSNKFDTEQMCIEKCHENGTKIRGECYLPKAQGNCTERLPRWFFNQTENRCMPYYYSGCEGNGNNFYFRELCEDICPSKIEQDICTLPALIGECHNYVERWYFDTLASRCRQFYYGGCGGNANNFVSEYSCQTRCQSAQLTTTSTTTAIPPFIVDVCDYPREAGPCSGSYNQWYYDKNADACYEFNYGGCQGNPNRFSDRESCERQCQKTSRQPATAKELTKNITTTTLMPSTSLILSQICYSLVDPGPCIDQIPAWYFDISTGQCRSFLYGGCEGNANRFTSEEECERQCGAFQGKDVCKLPVDIGPCLEGTYKRWYYDEDRLTCFPFIYSGCGGNFNRFKTFQSCLEFCTIQPTQTEKPDIDPRFPTTNKTDSCSTQTADCNILQERCPYGLEKWVDTSNCENCRCYDPCRSPDAKCPEHTQCAIEFHSVSGSKQFKTVCRPVHKVGECPQLEPANRPCTRECNTDADCPKDDKCCTDGCSVFCVKPSLPQVTTASTSTTTEKPIRGQPPLIPGETVESDIQAEEGNYATLKCTALGYPKPNIIWQKDGNIIDRSIGRFILIEDGTLKIIDLYRTDAGIYICIADNGIGDPARREFKLNINDGVDRQADIISDSTASGIVVSLGAPAVLQCYAYGWPRPTVTWWKEDKMLPLSTEQYEQRRDHSLAIRTVTIRSLGPYTCQAYNGIGRATSWSLTLHAVGPTYSIDPQDYDYIKYLVPPPKAPPLDASKKPQPGAASFPHSEINPTPTVASTAAVVTTPRFRVPVSAVISTNQTEYSVGTDISMPCDVDGYPIPTVNWYKDNELLQNNERIRISESNRLLIARITSADSGVYRCVANNGFSSSFSFINITIKGVYIAENCTDNPLFANCALIVKAQFCRHQYYAKFCCRACTLAGQLPGFSDRADYRTENDSGQIVKRSIDTGGTSCIDDPFFTRCDLIVKKQYCAQRYYAKLCCKSCATAGHLPMLHNHYEIASAPATKKTNTLI